MPNIVPAAAPGLPLVIIAVDPLPGLAGRRPSLPSRDAADVVEQERAMNAVLLALTAMLAEGGQHG